MTGLLRFVGILNAALWLGAAVFCSTTLLVAMNSREAVALLGTRYFDQVSSGLLQIIFTRLYYLQIICAVVAWAHLAAEWMYLGRLPRRFWLGLLSLLFVVSLVGGLWLCPKLATVHRAWYAAPSPAAAPHDFRVWNGVFQAVNLLMIGGIGGYFWRITHPQDEPRFVVPSKFRS